MENSSGCSSLKKKVAVKAVSRESSGLIMSQVAHFIKIVPEFDAFEKRVGNRERIMIKCETKPCSTNLRATCLLVPKAVFSSGADILINCHDRRSEGTLTQM